MKKISPLFGALAIAGFTLMGCSQSEYFDDVPPMPDQDPALQTQGVQSAQADFQHYRAPSPDPLRFDASWDYVAARKLQEFFTHIQFLNAQGDTSAFQDYVESTSAPDFRKGDDAFAFYIISLEKALKNHDIALSLPMEREVTLSLVIGYFELETWMKAIELEALQEYQSAHGLEIFGNRTGQKPRECVPAESAFVEYIRESQVPSYDMLDIVSISLIFQGAFTMHNPAAVIIAQRLEAYGGAYYEPVPKKGGMVCYDDMVESEAKTLNAATPG